jgi:hypothetical protein
MGFQPMYDPLDTLNWMVADARAELSAEAYVDPSGRRRAKSRSRREAERIRYETLCEVLWNVAGRPVELSEMTAAAA